MKGVRNGISIFLSTGYCIGTVTAMLLNAILPEDAEISYDKEYLEETKPVDIDEVKDVSDEDKGSSAKDNSAEEEVVVANEEMEA